MRLMRDVLHAKGAPWSMIFIPIDGSIGSLREGQNEELWTGKNDA